MTPTPDKVERVARAICKSDFPDDYCRSRNVCQTCRIQALAAIAAMDAPAFRLVWLVTETAFGRTTGWRHFLRLDEALATAGTWVAQSVGDVTISRREVPQ